MRVRADVRDDYWRHGSERVHEIRKNVIFNLIIFINVKIPMKIILLFIQSSMYRDRDLFSQCPVIFCSCAIRCALPHCWWWLSPLWLFSSWLVPTQPCLSLNIKRYTTTTTTTTTTPIKNARKRCFPLLFLHDALLKQHCTHYTIPALPRCCDLSPIPASLATFPFFRLFFGTTHLYVSQKESSHATALTRSPL